MSDTGPTQERSSSAGKRTKGVLWGRRVGIGLFWLMAAYVVGMAALSIVPSLFFPGFGPLAPSAETRDCAPGLQRLERDLMAHAASHLAEPSPPPLGIWLSDWDRRYAQLPPRCGALEATRDTLGRLREQLETMLRRYEAEHAPAHRNVRKALEAIRPPQ